MNQEIIDFNNKNLEGNFYSNRNHVEFSAFEDDYAEAYIDVVEDTLNHNGYVHGGAYTLLCDMASGAAVHSNGENYVTQNMNCNFISTVGSGRITAKARIIKRTHSFAICDVKIYSSDEKLLVSATVTYYRISGKQV
ncbi:MAG: PaaI family thioesterase [Lachnospiraceae bacterium]|nr:PaaI family thioesterase [Lachnospiraceae bacterium]